MIHVEPITEESLRYVLANLSRDDADELRAAGLEGKGIEAFEYGWRAAVDSGCIYFEDEPVAIFGAGPARQDTSVGVVWMVATDRFTERPHAMARLSRKVIARWRRKFRMLTNLVHCEHGRAIHWLRWLGFQVEPVGVGPRDAFFAFWMGGARV